MHSQPWHQDLVECGYVGPWVGCGEVALPAGVAPSCGLPAERGDDLPELPFGRGRVEEGGGFAEGERRIHAPLMRITARPSAGRTRLRRPRRGRPPPA